MYIICGYIYADRQEQKKNPSNFACSMSNLILLLLISLLGQHSVFGNGEMPLNGDNWQIKDSLGLLNSSVKARVPGQVHLDLM